MLRTFVRSLLLAVNFSLFAPAFASDKTEPPKPVPETQKAREELQRIRDSLDQLRDEHAKLKHTTEERPCDPHEGKPCKLCGG